CQECGEVICSKKDPLECPQCASSDLKQDEDVLDTWFSSALWPFSTLGWPEETPDMQKFYPTSVLVTGRDIIFFWVARMIFSGLEHTGKVPFYEVNIHGLILDAQGRKMSKSLGNGIDPIEVIEKYGADTLRFSMLTGVTPGNDIRFHWDKVENTRNFANKIWNASRFVLMNLDHYQPIQPESKEYNLADRWILSRYQMTVRQVTELLEKYNLGDAARALYDFIWDEFCDWYIELVKSRLVPTNDQRDRAVAQQVLHDVLMGTLRLLHPFMPFITEEIYQYLPQHNKTIMLDAWPQPDSSLVWQEAIEDMQDIMLAIRAIRNIRSEFNISPAAKIRVQMLVSDDEKIALLQENSAYIQNLAGVEQIDIREDGAAKPDQAVSALTSWAEIYVPLGGVIDVDKEIARLNKDLKAAEKDLKKARGKLNNEQFLSKAPAEVINKEKHKAAEAQARIEGIEQRLRIFTGM
ncbi:MAG TPA: class I tRNA ligase family protein, partial [Syntrophomonadaceae bacterium]|nr:class I tRNA ligase family protein [Syntrophomonadaceae bacterium]